MSFRSARIEAGKKVADVMAELHVTDATVYLWETGQTMPRASTLPKLAAFYGCTVDELLKGNPDGKPKPTPAT